MVPIMQENLVRWPPSREGLGPDARCAPGLIFDMDPDLNEVAERVRAALVRAAVLAYEDAAIRGLCGEGAWEVAVSAMRTLDLSPTVKP